MAPAATTALPTRSHPSITSNQEHNSTGLKPSGNLDKFTFEEATPVIGREYPTINIVDDLLNAPNADELVRDLAIAS